MAESTPLEHLEATLEAAPVLGFIAEARADDTEMPPPAADDATPRDARKS